MDRGTAITVELAVQVFLLAAVIGFIWFEIKAAGWAATRLLLRKLNGWQYALSSLAMMIVPTIIVGALLVLWWGNSAEGYCGGWLDIPVVPCSRRESYMEQAFWVEMTMAVPSIQWAVIVVFVFVRKWLQRDRLISA